MQKGGNALHYSAIGGHLSVTKYLVPKMGKHMFDRDDMGYTALHHAAEEGHLAIVEYFVKLCGFDIKARDQVVELSIVV